LYNSIIFNTAISMNIIKATSSGANRGLLSLLLCTLTIYSASYVITPLLPIYCIESTANGGLEWSKADTFSLFGTFLALLYISPFIGGLLGDFVLGKPLTAFLGYSLLGSGLIALSMYTDPTTVSLSLFALAIGIGCIKVTLSAALGKLPQEIRQKGYDYYYIATCLGFVGGGLIANPIFSAFKMTGVVATSLFCMGISLCFFFSFFGKEVFRGSQKEENVDTSSSATVAPSNNSCAFFILLMFAIPFFVCSHQLATGMPVFLHQCVNRTVGGRTIPTLWFGAIGSLTMTMISPWLRRAWNTVPASPQRIEPLKLSVGCAIIAASFATTAVFATVDPSIAVLSGIPLLLCIHLTCFIADFHVRPILYSSATSLVPARYHTLSTALVSTSIGLGGKLAGTLASFVDTIGFSVLFLICSILSAFCALLSFIWWKRLPQLGYIPASNRPLA
jgi:POT family proton-dependent oligopeptide transporter